MTSQFSLSQVWELGSRGTVSVDDDNSPSTSVTSVLATPKVMLFEGEEG